MQQNFGRTVQLTVDMSGKIALWPATDDCCTGFGWFAPVRTRRVDMRVKTVQPRDAPHTVYKGGDAGVAGTGASASGVRIALINILNTATLCSCDNALVPLLRPIVTGW